MTNPVYCADITRIIISLKVELDTMVNICLGQSRVLQTVMLWRIFNPATFSSESRALCGLTFFSLRAFTPSLLMTGSLSCSSQDHIRPERTRGSLSPHSLSHAPSLEFSSVCTSPTKSRVEDKVSQSKKVFRKMQV